MSDKLEALARALEYLANTGEISESLRLSLLELAAKEAGVRIIPRGASEPLVPIPDEIILEQADAEDAADDWDKLMPPEFRGMLRAQTIRKDYRDGQQ
jgi:hypothetical protein